MGKQEELLLTIGAVLLFMVLQPGEPRLETIPLDEEPESDWTWREPRRR